jgi:hypothetical protein
VRQYYALLPGDLDASWELLTERAQRKSGGRDGYAKFWSKIKSVAVVSAKAEDNRVAATLRFITQEDKESTEQYAFVLVDQDGKLMIDNFGQSRGG